MIEQKLRAIVPDEVNQFDKLTKGDPYYFSHWEKDRNGMACMYYWFYSRDKAKKNQKRVFMAEIERLLKKAHKSDPDIINRKLFVEQCPKTLLDGGCGYAVTVRLLEALGIVEYVGRVGARIINKDKIRDIIGI
jgi:hypothetical protein